MNKGLERQCKLQAQESFKIPESPVKPKLAIARARSVRKEKVTPEIKRVNSVLNIKTNVTELHSMKILEKDFYEKLQCSTERFFYQSCSKSKCISSKKTLANLGRHRLNPEQATKLLTKLPNLTCSNAIKDRVELIESSIFPKIIAQLKNGYHVLMHGFGSKRELVESFVKKYLDNENCVVVSGFQQNVTMPQVLNRIIEAFPIDTQGSSKSPLAYANLIREFFSIESENELFLIIHNIDGQAIRNSLECLKILSKSTNIHMLASIDHFYSDQLWTQYDPNWLWHDCTTVLPYTTETRVGNSRVMSEHSAAGLHSLRAVTASLHDHAKQVFLLLAKYQMENKAQGYEGMLIETLLARSRDSFFVTNELALRNLLTEFRDHKLIQFKIGVDRSEYIKITIDNDAITEFIDNFRDF